MLKMPAGGILSVMACFVNNLLVSGVPVDQPSDSTLPVSETMRD
jgi:hypothetical protein